MPNSLPDDGKTTQVLGGPFHGRTTDCEEKTWSVGEYLYCRYKGYYVYVDLFRTTVLMRVLYKGFLTDRYYYGTPSRATAEILKICHTTGLRPELYDLQIVTEEDL